MLKKVKFTNYLILILFILSSGSVLNVLGINDLIQITLFMVVLIISIKSGFLKNKKYVSIFITLVFLILILFSLQARRFVMHHHRLF